MAQHAQDPAVPGPPSPSEVVIVTVTTPDESVADELAVAVVEARVAACAQVGGPIRSTYRWAGAVQTDREWTVSIKTSEARLDEVCTFVRSMHPYELPEIVAVPAVGGDADYLRWVRLESDPG